MGRGNGNTYGAKVATARRSDFFEPREADRPASGDRWMEHVRDLKVTCELMLNLVRNSEPAGLTLSDIGNAALYCGAAQESVITARDLLREHHGIRMDLDGRWHLTSDETVLQEWRKQTRV